MGQICQSYFHGYAEIYSGRWTTDSNQNQQVIEYIWLEFLNEYTYNKIKFQRGQANFISVELEAKAIRR